jgi:adenylate cyclase
LDNLIADKNTLYFASPTKVSDDIVIIFLDEATMKGLPYRSPVPRDFLFSLNEKILAVGPKAIGYDIFFKDPTLEPIDNQLAASFENGPVYAVSAGKTDEANKEYEDLPMGLFFNALKGVGLADLPFSASDTTVRNAQFEFHINGNIRNNFVSTLYNAATGGSAEAVIHDPNNSLSIFGIKFLPYEFTNIRTYANTRIRYSGPPSKIGSENNLFKIFPAHLVEKGLIPTDWLKDKIVLVGAAYDDGTDAYITPYYASRYNYERMPGVEIHASILNQLLTRQFYYHVPQNIILVFMIIVGILFSLAFLHGSVWRSIVAVSAFTILFGLLIIVSFNKLGLIIPFVPLEGSMIATLGAALGYRFVTEGKQKRFIKGVFAKYVPPAVVDKMIANPKLLTLGGEQREITAMFTDIASFTTISERLDPKTLVSFLNDYLDKLTRIIFKYGGTLDKYEGDAIISFFGAPVELQNHREAALRASIEMQKACAEISDKWRSICGRDIVTRIGLNSGTVVVGNMGSDLRFDYTAIGDAMNLASRLEGANKHFDTRILASSAVIYDKNEGLKCPSDIVIRPVALVKVKGKTEAVKVFEIVGLKTETDPAIIDKIKNQPELKEIIELTSK